ncbi:unnamed protein product [Ambrosiozyma monospora]|uniref:Unnamed protein product n=1 Tax=Ambrosiozyma monospora TaxID=43982 RepID=A0ACB5T7U1_AMBMO|nr:unnamed protein product [Ambrosiozyma monospora]
MKPLRILYLKNLTNILFFLLCLKTVTSTPIPIQTQQETEDQLSWVGQHTTVRLSEVIPDSEQTTSTSISTSLSSSSDSSNDSDSASTNTSTELTTTESSESPSLVTLSIPAITTTETAEGGIYQKNQDTIYSFEPSSATTIPSVNHNAESTSSRSSIVLNTVPAKTVDVTFESMKPAFESEPAATSMSSDDNDNSSSSSKDQPTKQYGVSKVLIIILAVWGGIVLAIIIIYSYFYIRRRHMKKQAVEIFEKSHKHQRTASSISMTIGLSSTPIDLHRNPTIKTTGGFVKSPLPSMRRPNNAMVRSPVEAGTARPPTQDLLSSPISGMITSPTGTIISPVQLNYKRPTEATGMTQHSGGSQGTGLTGNTGVTQLDPNKYERQALRKSQQRSSHGSSKQSPRISRPEDVVVRRSFPRWI